MGRKKKYDRDSVLGESLALFWKRGFAGTSVADLEAATGVNKSGLYNEFTDKEELHRKTVEHYIESARERFLPLLERNPKGLDNIRDYLHAIGFETDLNGCYLVNSLREAGLLSRRTNLLIDDHFIQVRDLLKGNIRDGIRTGSMRRNLDVATTAELLLSIDFGLCLNGFRGQSAKSARRQVQLLLDLLKS